MRNLLFIFSFKNRNPLTAIFLFVIAVVILEIAFSFRPPNTLMQSLRTNRVATGSVPDWEIMGDSVAQGGIIATQLAGYLSDDQSVTNFAIASTGPEFPYFLLNRQIAAGKAPKKIIYAPSPHTFASKRIAILVGGFCNWREIFEIASSGVQPCEVVYGVLCKVSYTLRHREELKELFKTKKAPATKLETPRYPASRLKPMYKKPFTVEQFNGLFFLKFLTLAQEHNIPIYWVTMPVLPVVSESRKPFNFETDYYRFVDDLEKQFDVRDLQKKFILFGETDFIDYIHLNSVAAERFTEMLGAKLSLVLSHDDRLVETPPAFARDRSP
jgi:hypothetical protein